MQVVAKLDVSALSLPTSMWIEAVFQTIHVQELNVATSLKAGALQPGNQAYNSLDVFALSGPTRVWLSDSSNAAG